MQATSLQFSKGSKQRLADNDAVRKIPTNNTKDKYPSHWSCKEAIHLQGLNRSLDTGA